MNARNYAMRKFATAVAVAALAAASVTSSTAHADLFDDAISLRVEYRNDGSTTRQAIVNAETYIDQSGTVLLAPGATMAYVQEWTGSAEPVRVCVFIVHPDPEFLNPPGGGGVVRDGGPGRRTILANPSSLRDPARAGEDWPFRSCASLATPGEAAATFRRGVARAESVLLPASSLSFGDRIVVEFWFPVDTTNAARVSEIRAVAGDRMTDTGNWVKYNRDLLVWDWEEYALFSSERGDFSTALTPSTSDVVNLPPGAELVVGRYSETDEHHRRRAAYVPDYNRIFANLCVRMTRSGDDGEDESVTTLVPTPHLERTDRAYVVSALPLGETATIAWGPRVETEDGEACVEMRSYRIRRRNIGPYYSYTAVSEVVSGIVSLDANDLRSTSTTGLTIACRFGEGTRCLAGALFPLVLSWDFDVWAMSEFIAAYVGVHVLVAGEDDNLYVNAGLSMGARLLNSVLLGATYEFATGLWYFSIGGDVTGLAGLLRRAL